MAKSSVAETSACCSDFWRQIASLVGQGTGVPCLRAHNGDRPSTIQFMARCIDSAIRVHLLADLDVSCNVGVFGVESRSSTLQRKFESLLSKFQHFDASPVDARRITVSKARGAFEAVSNRFQIFGKEPEKCSRAQ